MLVSIFLFLFILGELFLFLFLYHLHFLRWLDLRDQERVTENSSPFYVGSTPMMKTFVREIVSYNVMILFHLLSPIYFAAFRNSPEKTRELLRSPGKAADVLTIPLVFIHGWGGRSSNFLWLASKLKKKFHLPLFFFSYPSIALSIEQAAQQLVDYCDRIQRIKGSDRIVLLCHSMGGLVARELLSHRGMRDRIAAIVTLGSPHRGTKLAFIGFSHSGRQMSPWSDFITRMKNREDELNGIPNVQIWSPADAAIVPASSACLPNAATEFSIECGHVEMLMRREIAQILFEFLPKLEESNPK